MHHKDLYEHTVNKKDFAKILPFDLHQNKHKPGNYSILGWCLCDILVMPISASWETQVLLLFSPEAQIRSQCFHSWRQGRAAQRAVHGHSGTAVWPSHSPTLPKARRCWHTCCTSVSPELLGSRAGNQC